MTRFVGTIDNICCLYSYIIDKYHGATYMLAVIDSRNVFVFVCNLIYTVKAEGTLVPDDATQVSSWHDYDYNVL